MLNEIKLIPVGIIKDFVPTKNQILVTSKGSSLSDLENPFYIYIQIESEEENLNLYSLRKVDTKTLRNNFIKLKILEILFRRKYYYVLLYEAFVELPNIHIRNLIYLDEAKMKKEKALYFYKKIKKEVYDENHRVIGKVVDYIDNSHKGVLVILLNLEELSKKEIMVPFVDEFVIIKKQNSSLKIILRNWEYFLI